MSDLFHQLGIDWRLLLSQAANFLLLFIILRAFAYKPVLKLLADRRMKIEEGLTKAKEADLRLSQANEMAKDKMKEAQAEAMEMLRETETKSKELEESLLQAAKKKEEHMIQNAELIIQGKAEQAREAMRAEAAALVKAALVSAVELDPKAIDEALVKKAVASAQKNSRP